MANEQKTAALEGAAERASRRRRTEVMQLILRALCIGSSIVSLSLMITAKQNKSVRIFGGIHYPVHAKWSFSQSFIFLVGVSVAVAAYSLLQLLIGLSRFFRSSSLISSRNHAWLIFAADQAFAYALMSAGSAASGVTSLNHTGIKLTPLPNFCKPLQKFCDHVAISIVFNFINCFLLATLAIHHVIWLSQH
ncbi:CASP-like protein 3A1 [Trifolium pratense]|uniref:CASP-like protein 3A1 n=1 Tax=Trifolium pratense TaxID=57577 RepID=UPI001E694B56|nr:CASP-like protein 3A1 [Trifolium pratense]